MRDAHLVVEDLGLGIRGLGDEARLKDLDDIVANVRKLLLNLATVLEDAGNVLLIALGLLLKRPADSAVRTSMTHRPGGQTNLVLDRGHDAPRRAAGTNDVLVGDREQVTLINRQLDLALGDLLHPSNHVCRK